MSAIISPQQWDRFKDVPWGVLAHSTHVRGTGTYVDGVERPRVQVTLATGLSRAVCERINLGYRDPASIDVESFADREDEGVLLVRKAGEQLYRLRRASLTRRRGRGSHKHRTADAVTMISSRGSSSHWMWPGEASELILGYYQSESLAVESKRDTLAGDGGRPRG